MNEIIIAFLTALVGGLIGTYGGARFLNLREDYKMKKVRAIAIKALDVIKKYSKQSYMNAESDFNTSLSITEKRMVIVALHKLGIPVGVPANEVFDIRKIHFLDKMIVSLAPADVGAVQARKIIINSKQNFLTKCQFNEYVLDSYFVLIFVLLDFIIY